MPKATLTFDLSSPDDVYAYKCANEGEKCRRILSDYEERLRGLAKYGLAKGQKFTPELERAHLWQEMREEGVDIHSD
jgi:hypothetical protein